MSKHSKKDVPVCPKQLPDDILKAAQNLAAAYWNSPIRPQLSDEVIKHWDTLIDAWADDETLPLFIRKQSADIGSILQHGTSLRSLAPCDNSPAHWAMITAFSKGTRIGLADIKATVAKHGIPVTMAMSKADIAASAMKGVLAKIKGTNASDYGWKVDHIDEVGLKQRRRIQEMAISDLKSHFKRLMKPSNIVLVPSALKGLGDMPAFIRYIKQSTPGPLGV
jgi:hypothetical protein